MLFSEALYTSCVNFVCFLHCHRDLLSLPTRRSSDLEAIHAGFTSVMIDASSKPLEENIATTRKVVELAHIHGVSDRKSTRLNSSHVAISYDVFCLKKKSMFFISE